MAFVNLYAPGNIQQLVYVVTTYWNATNAADDAALEH